MTDPFAPITVHRHDARAVVHPYGAHVTSWITPDASTGSGQAGEEQLFVSARSAYRVGAAIRGGVPVIFPQFSTEGPLPRHGFARTRVWQRVGAEPDAATFALHDDAGTRAIWPHAFAAEVRVSVERGALAMALSVANAGDDAFTFTAALHTYLRVRDVADVAIEGLGGVRYRDQAAGGVERSDDAAPLRIAGEVDRVYVGVPGAVAVREPDRTRVVRAEGFPDVVVWNPGAERARELTDLEPEGWRRFVCVEAAAIAAPVRLAPGERWTGTQRIST